MRFSFRHLEYFWTVVRAGQLTRACRELHVSPPTVSAQLKEFEARLGTPLLRKSGRTLVPTDAGKLVYRYADEIFGLARDMTDALARRPSDRPLRFVVGIDDVIPKEIARRLLAPALALGRRVQLVCREAGLDRLVAALAVHEVDVVLSDAPIAPSLNVRAYNHRLGGCDVTWMGVPALASRHRRRFPASLAGAPVLLPSLDTELRRSLDLWFAQLDLRPTVMGEFEDYALMHEYGRAGLGLLPVPAVLAGAARRRDRLRTVGTADGVASTYFAITVERELRHPAVIAICAAARDDALAA
jgi:LysR family transcriptional activator of nhaA